MDAAHREINRLVTERGVCDRTTSELLTIVLGASNVAAAEVDLLADAIEGGQLASAALTPDQLCCVADLTAAAVDVLGAMFELARRARLTGPPVTIRGPADVAVVAQRELGGRARECVLTVVCDASNRVLRTVIVARGSAAAAPVSVRDILNAVLRCDGSGFAIAHNHPAGILEATDADVAATERIAAGARAVGLRFLGHVLVGPDAGYADVPNSRLRAA